MEIVLTPETETTLRDRASRDGRDTNSLVESALVAFLEGEKVRNGHDIPYVDDDDYETLDKLIRGADANFAAGRFKSLDQMIADKRAQFGIEL